ncbi:hypothetical protein RHMOL_Rhmol10G0169900 [Rhododendron molle]|uniref:Uncharacterized protein n=1 Tax=Rhododendron molle TaxID=49168 RepID=A0ACC0M480_RHOML|nr:hypothetical protein RHMOL_Rhmol10G0169900 [Rhododendron molle]
MEERLQQVLAAIGSLTQRMEAFEVAISPRRRPIQSPFSKEEEVSDDISITQLLAGNHQSRARTMENEATIEWLFTSNIIPNPIRDWNGEVN